MNIHGPSIAPLRHAAPLGLPCSRVILGLPVPQVTTDLLSRGGKDIAFASYGPLWKFQRKLVHAALSMFGEGSLALERISKCPLPPPGLPPSSVCLQCLIWAGFFLSLCPDPLRTKGRLIGSAQTCWHPLSLSSGGSVPILPSPVLY